jgi:outer membrane immunogenic protein
MLFAAAVAATAIAANGSAVAADVRIPVKAPPPPPIMQVAPYSWSTCYVGTHTGLGSGHTKWTDPVPNGAIDATFAGLTATSDMSGALFGAQIGCDFQMNGNFVIGLEGSLAGTSLAGTNMDQFNTTWALRAQTDWVGTITGRAGFAIDRTLIYWRGGAAWARNKFEIENFAVLDGRPSLTRQGYVIGSGIEWAFAPSWSVFLEGNYFNFGNADVPFAGDVINPTAPFTVRSKQTMETIKFGVNYRMGGGF